MSMATGKEAVHLSFTTSSSTQAQWLDAHSKPTYVHI